ncbi:Major facilitator superfamily domain, general substrate transporter [Metarhizium album ARSEF 1941]|uniref:Major facilitator superfamily domain, general substrate transporter n=1 Tax=Metarhizium album (strain ARSEF 1941) TaxID=1081103 RepID=A0A0B2WY82_METAS|nr:Major facilitator superfamily domain, general substrate transporter [Metarhizium album ARSEF 1941]KHN98372.1 Major facilitator superfamily domain, general substrate transporter [Metarhizium album ARSEF 1941]
MSGDGIAPAPAAHAAMAIDEDGEANVEHGRPESRVPRLPNMDPGRRAAVEKRLKRKLDARCGLFVLIYIMNYLDRNNIASARLKGLQEDLKLDDTQYATCLSILYVGYILMQVPSNMFINRIQRPSLYIACSMLLWGLVSTLSGNAKDFAGMAVIRFFLGFIEAAFLPGALLILSKWYTRRELTTRNAILFAGNLISNAFSALVGAGVLSNMQGVLGHAAWRWLFWIEGAATMSIAVVAVFILPDLPHNARGFTDEERAVAQLRMFEDVGEADADPADQGIFDGLVMSLTDPKIYVMMLTFTAYVVGLSFNAFFFWHIVGPIVMGIVGFVISMSTLNVAARYLALFLQAGSYAGFIVFYSWISSTFPRPPAKRAVAIALINAFSQLGNVAGSYVWALKDDGFRKSYGIVLSMFGVTMAGCWILRTMLVRLNRRLEEEETAETRQGAGEGNRGTEDGHVEKTDENLHMRKGFRYLV